MPFPPRPPPQRDLPPPPPRRARLRSSSLICWLVLSITSSGHTLVIKWNANWVYNWGDVRILLLVSMPNNAPERCLKLCHYPHEVIRTSPRSLYSQLVQSGRSYERSPLCCLPRTSLWAEHKCHLQNSSQVLVIMSFPNVPRCGVIIHHQASNKYKSNQLAV